MVKNEVVVQSNKLVEAHYKQQYTVQEQRMVLWVISEIHKEDYFKSGKYEYKKITISAQKYAELMGITVDDVYKRAKKIGDDLMQKVITIETETGWEKFHWMAQMTYNGGHIEALITPAILPHIIDLKEKFTAFRLENILYLRSSHAIKLYQILAQYKQVGERTITIDKLRAMLGIYKEKSYALFGHIKSKILDISKREINSKTDLTISYLTIKQSRKVVGINFKITQKPNQAAQVKKEFEKHILQLPNDNVLKAIFEKYGFEQIVIKNSFQEFLNEKVLNYDPQSPKPLKLKKNN
ncbi:MAG: replication initiation protein [Bacteroidetes bacterium]|nr:replication initiation protein [Bacteroidota bacterium]